MDSQASLNVASSVRPARRPVGCMIGTFLLGILVGAVALALFFVFSQADKPAVAVPPAQGNSTLQVRLSSSYITQLVNKEMQSPGSFGNVSNVQVQLTNNQMIVTGDDQIGVLGLSMTKPFTLVVQPYIQSCKPRLHILHADVGGVPATGLASSFEDHINQQLHFNVADLPTGFTYCATNVRTESGALIVDFSATPQT
jgi:hypothetical protein